MCACVCVLRARQIQLDKSKTSSNKSGLLTSTHTHTHSEEKKRSTFEKLRHDSTLRKQLPVRTSVHKLQAAPDSNFAYIFLAGSRLKRSSCVLCHVAIMQQLFMHRQPYTRQNSAFYCGESYTTTACTATKKLTPFWCLQCHPCTKLKCSQFIFFHCESKRDTKQLWIIKIQDQLMIKLVWNKSKCEFPLIWQTDNVKCKEKN